MNNDIQIGAKYSSFEELKNIIQRYQSTKFCQLYVKDSRTIASTLKRTPSRKINEELRYSHIVYSCIAGGKSFKSRSNGLRPNQRTFRNGCPMEIKAFATKDGRHLEVIAMEETHNHEVDKISLTHLPQQRRLDKDVLDETKKMLAMKCNKAMLQNHLTKTTGQVVTGRDISNMRVKAAKMKCGKKNDLEAIAKKLSENAGSTTEVVVDDNSNLLGIFYQDVAMKTAYDSFPEMIFVDATHRLNELRMPLYILVAEDGNGESEIVAVFLVANEEGSTIRKMVEIFKNCNPSWAKTQTIMSDKDFTERQVFATEFPKAKLLICLFHTQRTFRRELTAEKMGITSEERNLCLEILQKMTYAGNLEQYEELHSELRATEIESVVSYFEDNWHPIHMQWVEGLKSMNATYLNRTNNRIESINQKIKSVCFKFSDLDTFFDELLVAIRSLRDIRDHKAIMMMQKRPVVAFGPGSPESAYMQALTPYAFSFVSKQIKLSEKVILPSDAAENETVEVTSSSTTVKVSHFSCECSFWTAMNLPCRHIFALRKAAGVELFDSNLFATRWRMDYYCSKHHVMKDIGMPSTITTVCVKEPSTISILSPGQKYKKVFQLCQELSSVVSEAPMRQYTSHMKVLNLLLQSWKDGIEVSLHPVDLESDKQEPSVGDATTSGSVPKDILLVSTISDKTSKGNIPENISQQVQPSTSELESASTSSGCLKLTQVKIPPKIPKRGRPKGAEFTTIGLPRKKAKTSNTGKSKPIPFVKKLPQEKDKVLLSWLLDEKDVSRALRGDIIDEDLLETRPERVNPALAGENVNYMRLRRYFSKDAWLLIEDVVKQIKMTDSWMCQCCNTELNDTQSIGCDTCLSWYHFSYVALKKPLKAKFWFCRTCYK